MSTITKLDLGVRLQRTERRTLVTFYGAKPGVQYLEVWLKLKTICRRPYRTGSQKQAAVAAVVNDLAGG